MSAISNQADPNNMVLAENINRKDDLLKRALERSDDCGLQVHSRIAGMVGDLVACEARYHKR